MSPLHHVSIVSQSDPAASHCCRLYAANDAGCGPGLPLASRSCSPIIPSLPGLPSNLRPLPTAPLLRPHAWPPLPSLPLLPRHLRHNHMHDHDMQILGAFTGPTYSIVLQPASCDVIQDPQTGVKRVDWENCEPLTLVISETPGGSGPSHFTLCYGVILRWSCQRLRGPSSAHAGDGLK